MLKNVEKVERCKKMSKKLKSVKKCKKCQNVQKHQKLQKISKISKHQKCKKHQNVNTKQYKATHNNTRTVLCPGFKQYKKQFKPFRAEPYTNNQKTFAMLQTIHKPSLADMARQWSLLLT